MCTAVSFFPGDHYFGRNLDLEYALEESVTITPRNYPLYFAEARSLRSHYAFIGIATVAEGYPLYYDATNEAGLSMAALNFPGNAVYLPTTDVKDNIAPFELIPWILGQCKTVAEARALLERINVINLPFSEKYPLTPLHWIIADRETTIVAEPVESGLVLYKNPVGVLTNNPPFPYHLQNLCNFLNLTAEEPENRFSLNLDLKPYSRGMGAFGLPGDLSSASRFVRAAFVKSNSQCANTENASVNQFFHILESVAMQRGCVSISGNYEITVYASCCNTTAGIYYYKTYENSGLTAVSLFREDLDGKHPVSYPLRTEPTVTYENH